MKQESNNEIDLLLRRLSRHQGAAPPDGDLRDHLDADELSSYAENALPVAARARYTEHLAECSRCRELVVQLSSAAGVVVAAEPARVPAASGLRKVLASLFSPMVLRYAVPALGLIVVAVIGFTVFRGDRGSSSPEMVATHRPVETPTVAQQTKLEPEGLVDKEDKFGSVAPTPERRGQRKEAEPSVPQATPAANVAADAVREAPVAQTESQPVTAAAPAAAPAPKPAETTDEARKRESEAQREEAQGRTASINRSQREKVLQDTAEDKQQAAGTRRPAKSGAVVSAPAGAGSAATFGSSSGKDRDDGETRTVEGRRFRKQGGVWVDTAYAGGATVDLTRGSEHYRSLVADEPSIKRIADQLDGQIIVVWKGRAYKIR